MSQLFGQLLAQFWAAMKRRRRILKQRNRPLSVFVGNDQGLNRIDRRVDVGLAALFPQHTPLQVQTVSLNFRRV